MEYQESKANGARLDAVRSQTTQRFVYVCIHNGRMVLLVLRLVSRLLLYGYRGHRVLYMENIKHRSDRSNYVCSDFELLSLLEALLDGEGEGMEVACL